MILALQGSGVTFANFTGVSTLFGNSSALAGLQWTFGLATPLTSLKDTLAMLASLQKGVMQKNRNLALSFSVQGTQISQPLQQSQTCAIPDLIADARTKAQTLASAGGRSLGGILALSGATNSVSSPASQVYNGVSPPSPQGCSITVKFALLGS